MKSKKIISVVMLVAFLTTSVYPAVGLIGPDGGEGTPDTDTSGGDSSGTETSYLEGVVDYLKNTYNGAYSTDISNKITSSDLTFIAYSKGSEPLSYGTSYGTPASLSPDTPQCKRSSIKFQDGSGSDAGSSTPDGSSGSDAGGSNPSSYSPVSYFNPSQLTNSNEGTPASYSPDTPVTPGSGGTQGTYHPARMTFEMPESSFFAEFPPITLGSDPATTTGIIWIKNSGYGSVTFEISENCDWITSVYPTKGILRGTKCHFILPPDEEYDGVISGIGEPVYISIEINVEKLSPGSHSAPLTFKHLDQGFFEGDGIQPESPDWATTDLPVVTTLWADPSKGPSPRYRILGTESRHAWNVGYGYWGANDKFSVILEVWDEGIETADSITASLQEGWEIYDLDLGIGTDSSQLGHKILTSPMAKATSYNGEHRNIKAQVSEMSGSLSVNFDGIGPYDFSVYSDWPLSRAPAWAIMWTYNECTNTWVHGPLCPNPRLYWSNPYQVGSIVNPWVGVNLGQIPTSKSGSSCYVAWNPVAYEYGAPAIGYSIFPTTQAELNIWGIDFDDVADWNGETECPIITSNPCGQLIGGGSPFGEGMFERNSRATWDFSSRNNLPAGHYIVPMNLMYEIDNTVCDANGNWYSLIMLLIGAFYFEFDVVENTYEWPPLTQNPDYWPVYENQTSFTMFDVTGKSSILFTPLSSFGRGKNGGVADDPSAPGEEPVKKVVYDMYPKRPVEWCQLTPSNDYGSDFTFINTTLGDTPVPIPPGGNSAKILGVNYRVEDRRRPPQPTAEDEIGSVQSKAFLVAGGYYSGNMINMILSNPPITPPADPSGGTSDPDDPDDPQDPPTDPGGRTGFFSSLIQKILEWISSIFKKV